jgi:tRNA(Ile2)-agmatinylcytidine synthase
MCTTYLVTEILKEFEEWDLIGYPRLVRLNPNIPWKTRGNGAICVKLGKGRGKRILVSEVKGKPFFAFEKGGAIDEKPRVFMKRTITIVERLAHFNMKGTNPAILVSSRKPAPAQYWKTVRGVVKIKETGNVLPKGSIKRTWKNGRGIIGACAAMAWRPRDRTWEIITYRKRDKWGKKRKINKSDMIKLDERFPSTFNNHDEINKHIACIPNSPCPVLFGIRGDNPRELIRAMRSIRTETASAWVLFETNQGTDDHIVDVGSISLYRSGIIRGKVARKPWTITGGHVLIEISTKKRRQVCAAYEPTKEFRDVIKALIPGDNVSAVGGRTGQNPGTVALEKIRINKLVTDFQKVRNPVCPACGKAMRSIGRNSGYRCRDCREYAGDAIYNKVPRTVTTGMFEVPVCARRHLSKPLVRYQDNINMGKLKKQ